MRRRVRAKPRRVGRSCRAVAVAVEVDADRRLVGRVATPVNAGFDGSVLSAIVCTGPPLSARTPDAAGGDLGEHGSPDGAFIDAAAGIEVPDQAGC